MELSLENQKIRDHHIASFNKAAKAKKRKYRASVATKEEYIDGKEVHMVIKQPNGDLISKWHVLGWVPGFVDAQIQVLWEVTVLK